MFCLGVGAAYIGQVSQFNLQAGLGRLGLGSHSHGNHLGVHNCMIPETNKGGQTKKKKLKVP